MISIGFQTKLAAALLMALLMVENIFLNNFWAYAVNSSVFDFKLCGPCYCGLLFSRAPSPLWWRGGHLEHWRLAKVVRKS